MVEIIEVAEELPRDPKSRYWRGRPLKKITKIVVHYDAVRVPRGEYDPVERYRAQARYHMARNWNEDGGPPVYGFGLMYHYRVSADGRVWRTQPEALLTWHARAANYAGLAICCDLGPGQKPTEAQLAGLRSLLDWLCYRRPDIPAGRKDVWGHCELKREGNRTACPGALLPWVQAYREGTQAKEPAA
jgi:hypothetical protein